MQAFEGVARDTRCARANVHLVQVAAIEEGLFPDRLQVVRQSESIQAT